MMFIQCYLV
uniref:Uncharacterized protein n=1 Tax=Arundo donax TaxID=35708 RepID=A0A0A8ZW32_ARUDO